MGVTRSTTSSGRSRLPNRLDGGRFSACCWYSFPSCSLNVWIPCPVLALTAMPVSGTLSAMSHLFHTCNTGICCCSSCCKMVWSASVMPVEASITSTARSVWENARLACCTRSSPSVPVSSRPGVSISTTAPIGSSSIAFSTVSVVVPQTGETTEIVCPATALIRLDLPAFRRPKKPMCTRLARGVWLRFCSISVSP